MALALLTTDAASGGAGLKHAAHQLFIGAGPPRGDGARRCARICTVLIETDALGELLDHLLTEASIRTGRAGLRTGGTLLDTADQTTGRASSTARECQYV